ncbi:IS66 family transposase [Candidatus Micrarchaeota archaeon]|nr:IS66 family transposase [Candidatus Micrarchaeota archaeon]
MSSELEKLVLAVDSLKRQVGHLAEQNQQLQRQLAERDKVISAQNRRITELEALVEQLKTENKSWAREFDKLRKHLRKYENENMPSGSIPPYLKPEVEEKLPKERAEPEGKTANIRNSRKGKPDRKELHGLAACPHCGGKVRKMKAKPDRRRIIHITMPTVEDVEHITPRYFCGHCKKEVAAKIGGTLPGSKFDLNAMLLISYLAVAMNMSENKVVEFFSDIFGLEISGASVSNVMLRLREHLGPYYWQLEKRLKRARVVYRDETSWRKNGKTYWTWVATNARLAYFAIERRRNAETAGKLKLRKDAVQVCDGYTVYSGIMQRCWAHSLRRAKHPENFFENEEESGEYSAIVGELGSLYHDAKETRKKGCSKELRERYSRKLLKLFANREPPGKNLAALTNYVMSYSNDWFTFLEYPYVEPTNNRAERALRHIVLKRRISQQSRSQLHMESYAMQASAYMTARLNGESYWETLGHVVGSQISGAGKI